MSLTLYGLIRHDQAIDFGPIGFEGAPVQSIPAGLFAAVVGSSPKKDPKSIPREDLVKQLLSHQTTLERVMQRFFVLPFKFGTTVVDEAELKDILRKGESFLISLEEKVKDCIETDVVATWDVRSMLQEISEEDPKIVECKQEMAHGLGDRAFVGMLLANALKRRAEQWRGKITEVLKIHSKACAEHDLLDDTMVLNSSFLIPRDGEREFHRTLEEIDLSFKKKLNLKCVGPLPPYSFATVLLQRFNPQEIQGAANLLGLNGKAELTFVKKIYKELSRQCHPDRDPNLSMEKFEELNRAYELLADYCKDGPGSLGREAIGKYVRLKVMENPHAA